MASAIGIPAASAAAKVATTVSPAPETSYTSLASVGMSCEASGAIYDIPFSERVTNREVRLYSFSIRFAALCISLSSFLTSIPETAESSFRLGVMMVAERYFSQFVPLGSIMTFFPCPAEADITCWHTVSLHTPLP